MRLSQHTSKQIYRKHRQNWICSTKPFGFRIHFPGSETGILGVQNVSAHICIPSDTRNYLEHLNHKILWYLCLLSPPSFLIHIHYVSSPPKTILLAKFSNAVVSKSKIRPNYSTSPLPSHQNAIPHTVQLTEISIHVVCLVCVSVHCARLIQPVDLALSKRRLSLVLENFIHTVSRMILPSSEC